MYGKKEGGGARRHEKCYQYLGNHHPTECKFKESEFYHCGKKGHIGRVCREKQVLQVQHVEPADTGGTDEYSLFSSVTASKLRREECSNCELDYHIWCMLLCHLCNLSGYPVLHICGCLSPVAPYP